MVLFSFINKKIEKKNSIIIHYSYNCKSQLLQGNSYLQATMFGSAVLPQGRGRGGRGRGRGSGRGRGRGRGWGPCREGDKCTRHGCNFTHPRDGTAARWGPCREGDECTRHGCNFTHPRDDVLSVEKSMSPSNVGKDAAHEGDVLPLYIPTIVTGLGPGALRELLQLTITEISTKAPDSLREILEQQVAGVKVDVNEDENEEVNPSQAHQVLHDDWVDSV